MRHLVHGRREPIGTEPFVSDCRQFAAHRQLEHEPHLSAAVSVRHPRLAADPRTGGPYMVQLRRIACLVFVTHQGVAGPPVEPAGRSVRYRRGERIASRRRVGVRSVWRQRTPGQSDCAPRRFVDRPKGIGNCLQCAVGRHGRDHHLGRLGWLARSHQCPKAIHLGRVPAQQATQDRGFAMDRGCRA